MKKLVSLLTSTDGMGNAACVGLILRSILVMSIPNYCDNSSYVTESYSKPPVQKTRSYTVPGCWGSPPSSTPETVSEYRGSYKAVRLNCYHKRKEALELLPMNFYSRWDELAEGTIDISAHYDNGAACSGDIDVTDVAWNLQGADPGTEGLYKSLDVNENALLLSAIGNSVPRLDVLTSAAEFGKTLDLVTNVRKRAVSLIKRLRWKGWKALPENASDLWLEWRYGWRLLGFEIEAATNAINNPLKAQFVEGRAGNSYLLEFEEAGESFPLLHWATRVDAHTSVLHRHDISVRANVNGKVRLQSANVLVSPVITGWELIPYSFVLDWFVNVGDVLSSWKALQLADYTCSIGVKRESTLTGRIDYVESYDGAYTSQHATGSATLNGETKIRWPRSVPKLTPAINVDLTTKRSLDLAALMYSTSTSLRR